MEQKLKQKDPAALFYIDTWLAATAEMDSDVRGWYLNLILHQYDKKSLPNNIEKLASLAMVRFSEFGRFQDVWFNTLSSKFDVNQENRLENPIAKEIIRKRKRFIDEKTRAGRLGYFINFATKEFQLTMEQIQFLKSNVDLDNIDLKDQHMLKQQVEHLLELLINETETENINEFKFEYADENEPEDDNRNEPEDEY